MATYVNDLRLKEIATGDESGTWGTSTNTNLELIAEAFSYGTEAITTNADTHTTTIADGASDPGRALYLKYTGTLDSACTITIGPNTVSKVWIVENGTTGSQNIILSQGSGANITIPAGDTKVVYSDGAGAGAAFFDAFASLNVGALTGTSLDISGDIDVDGTTNLDIVDIDGALTQDGGAVFNEASADVDFRVESDGNANMLFVDGGTNRVGIGLNSPQAGIDIDSSAKGIFTGGNVYSYPTGNAYIKTQGTSNEHNWIGITGVYNDNSSSANLLLQANVRNTSEQAGNYIGSEAQSVTAADITFGKLVGGSSVGVNATKSEFMRIDSSGNVGIGTSSPEKILHIKTSVNNTAFARIESTAANSYPTLSIKNDAREYQLTTHGGVSDSFVIYDGTAGANRLVINTSGNVGIGTASPTFSAGGGLNVAQATFATMRATGGASTGVDFAQASDGKGYVYVRDNADLIFGTNNAERLRIDSSGNVGIGTAAPTVKLDVNSSTVQSEVKLSNSGTGNTASDGFGLLNNGSTAYVWNYEAGVLLFGTSNAERMRIDSSGNVGIGTTSVSSPSGAAGPVLQMKGANPELAFYDNSGGDNQASIYYLNNLMVWHSPTYGGTVLRLTTSNGNLQVIGALSKGSGSFKIDHPLPAKTDTHHLIHSFIEGPQADNIYRGKVDLVSGSATVNIDTVAGMTEGTFVALNREVQCFTTNESNWDAVKGSVSGNILTIESENSESTATISWLVIGERQDQHMYDTDWTDENGKVIVEPLKTNEE